MSFNRIFVEFSSSLDAKYTAAPLVARFPVKFVFIRTYEPVKTIAPLRKLLKFDPVICTVPLVVAGKAGPGALTDPVKRLLAT